MKKTLYIADWKPDSAQSDAVIYKLSPDDLQSEDVRRIELSSGDVDPILAPLMPLIERNVSFAAIPENFGEGSACYLINLMSLKGE